MENFRFRSAVGDLRFELAGSRGRRFATGGTSMLCGDDHGLFHCLDILIINNKRTGGGTGLTDRTSEV